MKDLNENKRFWKKIKPLSSDKGLHINNFILKDKNRLVNDSSITANIFNNYFISTTNVLNLKPSMPKSKSFSNLLELYEDHFSVSKIENTKFIEVSPDKVRKIMQPLNKKKSAISFCIPVIHLTESVDIYLQFLTDIINQPLKNSIFPDELELAEVIPIFKKADPFEKMNY